VAGGAEALCRQVATRLAARGHRVEVITTCARSYVTWEDFYEAGAEELDGVIVHRHPVRAPRDERMFSALHARVVGADKPVPYHLQRAWMQAQGPWSPPLIEDLVKRAPEVDVVTFFTYLYWTTWAGLAAAAGLAPMALQTTAHDEPPFHLAIFEEVLRRADGLLFLTPEEAGLVQRRLGAYRPFAMPGAGVRLDVSSDPARFRRRYGLGDDPYLLYTGRVDPHKGAVELLTFFTTYKARNPSPLRLVVVGEQVVELDAHADVVSTGFVDEATRDDAIGGCIAAVVPSFFESLSLSLCEAWAHARPALVQGRCDVLQGQVRRSGGGIAYTGFAEFETAVEEMRARPSLGPALGAAGRAYVERLYDWDIVLDAYERFFWLLAKQSRRLDGVPQRGDVAPAGPRSTS